MTDELPKVRSHAERVRVWQGWALILLSFANITLLILRT
jgi:hypothetical protein